jgi:hypothetical protein
MSEPTLREQNRIRKDNFPSSHGSPVAKVPVGSAAAIVRTVGNRRFLRTKGGMIAFEDR